MVHVYLCVYIYLNTHGFWRKFFEIAYSHLFTESLWWAFKYLKRVETMAKFWPKYGMIQYYSCSHSQKWPKICLIYSSCTDLITLAQQEPTKALEQQEEEQVEKTLENVCKYSTHTHTQGHSIERYAEISSRWFTTRVRLILSCKCFVMLFEFAYFFSSSSTLVKICST